MGGGGGVLLHMATLSKTNRGLIGGVLNLHSQSFINDIIL